MNQHPRKSVRSPASLVKARARSSELTPYFKCVHALSRGMYQLLGILILFSSIANACSPPQVSQHMYSSLSLYPHLLNHMNRTYDPSEVWLSGWKAHKVLDACHQYPIKAGTDKCGRLWHWHDEMQRCGTDVESVRRWDEHGNNNE